MIGREHLQNSMKDTVQPGERGTCEQHSSYYVGQGLVLSPTDLSRCLLSPGLLSSFICNRCTTAPMHEQLSQPYRHDMYDLLGHVTRTRQSQPPIEPAIWKEKTNGSGSATSVRGRKGGSRRGGGAAALACTEQTLNGIGPPTNVSIGITFIILRKSHLKFCACCRTLPFFLSILGLTVLDGMLGLNVGMD